MKENLTAHLFSGGFERTQREFSPGGQRSNESRRWRSDARFAISIGALENSFTPQPRSRNYAKMFSLFCRRAPDCGSTESAAVAAPSGTRRHPRIQTGRNRTLVQVTATSALLFSNATAADFEDFLSYNFHDFLIQPQLELGESYTDNLTYTSGIGQISDLQSIFSPGLRLQKGDQKGNFASVKYNHDEVLFLDHSESNYRQNRFKGNGLYSTARTRFDVSEEYDQLSGFLGGILGQSGAINVVPRRRDILFGTARLTYDWSARTDFYADFSHYVTDWAKDVSLYDSSIMRGAVGADYQLTDRIHLFSEASYGQTGVSANQLNQPRGVASAVYGLFLGARGNFTSRLSGTAKFGVEERAFFERGRSGVLIPAFDLNLRFIVTDATLLQLQYNRLSSPSMNFGGQSVTSDTATLTGTHILGGSGMWYLRAVTTFQLADYSSTTAVFGSTGRTDDFLNAELGLFYRPQPWLTASVGYAFEYYKVNFENPVLAQRSLTGYQANRVFLNLSLGF